MSDYDRKVIRVYGVETFDFAGLKGYSSAKRSIFIIDKARYCKVYLVERKP